MILSSYLSPLAVEYFVARWHRIHKVYLALLIDQIHE